MNDGFGISKVEISRLQTRNVETTNKIEDVELQASSYKNDSQTQKQLAEQLGVSQHAVSKLREVGKIQNTGRWVSHELNELNDKQM